MNENDLEQLALTWFQDTGWDYRAGPDMCLVGVPEVELALNGEGA